jgi:hypothetical protein
MVLSCKLLTIETIWDEGNAKQETLFYKLRLEQAQGRGKREEGRKESALPRTGTPRPRSASGWNNPSTEEN